MDKVQPHCVVCKQPFRKDEIVQVDKLFSHFTHFFCCELDKRDIQEIGKYGEIVASNKKYKKMYIVQ
jgi:hypothetical protein